MAQHTRTVLNIRMTNGQSLRAEFGSDCTMYQVKAYVDQNRTDGRAAYNLTTAFPKQVFSDPDALNLTLDLAGLCPSGTLIMTPTESSQPETQVHETPSHASFDYMQAPLPRSLVERSSNSAQSRSFWYYVSYLNPMSYIWDDDDELAQYSNQTNTTQQRNTTRQATRSSRGPNIHGFSSSSTSSSANDEAANQMNELQPKPGLHGWEFGPNLELEKYLRNQYANPQPNRGQGSLPASASYPNTQSTQAQPQQQQSQAPSQPRRGNSRAYGARVHGFSDYAASTPPR